jgi:hypothetical protein
VAALYEGSYAFPEIIGGALLRVYLDCIFQFLVKPAAGVSG